jgi:hypothetical protein
MVLLILLTICPSCHCLLLCFLSQAARNAVVKRLEWLDANFLAALNAYMLVPGVATNADMRGLLGAIRDEVLDLVSDFFHNRVMTDLHAPPYFSCWCLAAKSTIEMAVVASQ